MSGGGSFLVALQLDGKRCVVVGSSDEAARRARELAAAGARVVAIGAEPCPELELLAAQGHVALERREPSIEDLDGAWLVVLADRDPGLVERLGPACAARRILFCAVDQPGHNSFHHVAVARSGSISVAVSSDGVAPALAKRLRDELERVLGDAGVGSFAAHLAQLRARLAGSERKRILTAQAARLELLGIEIAPDPTEGVEE